MRKCLKSQIAGLLWVFKASHGALPYFKAVVPVTGFLPPQTLSLICRLLSLLGHSAHVSHHLCRVQTSSQVCVGEIFQYQETDFSTDSLQQDLLLPVYFRASSESRASYGSYQHSLPSGIVRSTLSCSTLLMPVNNSGYYYWGPSKCFPAVLALLLHPYEYIFLFFTVCFSDLLPTNVDPGLYLEGFLLFGLHQGGCYSNKSKIV